MDYMEMHINHGSSYLNEFAKIKQPCNILLTYIVQLCGQKTYKSFSRHNKDVTER